MPNHVQTTDEVFYSKNALDPSAVNRIVDHALAGADDGELFMEYIQSEYLAWDDGKLKSCNYDTDTGFGLRSVAGEQFGFAHANDLSENALQRAADTVREAQKGYSGQMDVHPNGTNSFLYTDKNPITQVPFENKVKLLESIDAYARTSDSRVKQVSVALSASWKAVQIVRGDGHKVADIRPLVRLSIAVYMEDANGRMEEGHHGFGGRHAYDSLFDEQNWKAGVKEALRQADVNLQSVAGPAGEMTVVMGSGWPGILLHEAVGHGLEGDFNRKGTSAFSGLIGKQVAAKGVTIVDDGTIEHARGSITVDDEGTPSGRTVLIEDGILTGYMQDRMNARLMGKTPTGNGRRESYADPVMPRMTNTIMENGQHTPEDVIASVDKGVYMVNFSGGQVDITSGKFVFSATEAYAIEKGKITTPLKGATVIGNGPDALTKVGMIGNDMQLDDGIATCGKDGQSVPVGVGQPTLRIDGLTVGGTATT